MSNNKILRETLYFSRKPFTDSFSELDYVKINKQNNGIGSYFENGQVKLYKEDKSYGGMVYNNKNTQFNSTIINSTSTPTLSTENGILVFMMPYNSYLPVPSQNFYFKPIYQSGDYLNKDIIIQIEILSDIEETRKITIYY